MAGSSIGIRRSTATIPTEKRVEYPHRRGVAALAYLANGGFEQWYARSTVVRRPTEQARLEAMPVGATSPKNVVPGRVFRRSSDESRPYTPR